MKKCATADTVLSKNKDSENMTAENFRKVLAPLKLKQDKAIPRTQNDLLISYCQWKHVEKRERRVIDGEEQNLNAVNSTDCVDKLISYNTVDELIATDITAGDSADFSGNAAGGFLAAINYVKSMDSADHSISNYAGDGFITTSIDDGNSTGCAEDTAGGFIGAINDGNSIDCADIKVSDDAAGGLIAITIDASNSVYFAEDAAGGLINHIDDGLSMNFADKSISDDAVDGFIATLIDAGVLIANNIHLTENDDTNVSYDAIDGLMMLIC